MNSVDLKTCCDFHCWVIKYDCEIGMYYDTDPERVPVCGKTYLKGSLKSDYNLVPLLWNHDHNCPDAVIGCATLEYRDEGVYAYCKLFHKPNVDTTKQFLMAKGSVSLSPFVNNIKYDGNNITHGEIREVSLIFDRVDRDEAYFPIMGTEEEESTDDKRNLI